MSARVVRIGRLLDRATEAAEADLTFEANICMAQAARLAAMTDAEFDTAEAARMARKVLVTA